MTPPSLGNRQTGTDLVLRRRHPDQLDDVARHQLLPHPVLNRVPQNGMDHLHRTRRQGLPIVAAATLDLLPAGIEQPADVLRRQPVEADAAEVRHDEPLRDFRYVTTVAGRRGPLAVRAPADAATSGGKDATKSRSASAGIRRQAPT